jgi:hypothetical protein
MLADGYPLGRCRWDSNLVPRGGPVAPSGVPPGASLCDTFVLSLYCLPFLPFQISEELAVLHELWNSRSTTLILTQAKAGKTWEQASYAVKGSHPRRRWCDGGRLTGGRSLGTSTGSVCGGQTGPRAPQILTRI